MGDGMKSLSDIKIEIDAILAGAQENYEWGGDEGEDGGLSPGPVDWETLRALVAQKLAELEPKI